MFSLDSVITAVGMADQLWVMVVAVIGGGDRDAGGLRPALQLHRRDDPTVKMLALSFLLLIGVLLIAEGLHFHIPKGYVYAAMGFSGLRRGAQPAARGSGADHRSSCVRPS